VSEAKISEGAVSATKLANLAVTTDKINWLAVTEPKTDTALLARRHIEAYLAGNRQIYDDFNGVGLPYRWRVRADAGGYSYFDTVHQCLTMATPAINGQGIRLDWAEKGIKPNLFPVSVIFFVPTNASGVKTYQTRKLGLMSSFDESEYFYFRASDAVGATPNWYAVKKMAGQAEVAVDTGVALADPQLLEIEILSQSVVRYYINGVLVYTHTGWPNPFLLDPWMSLHAGSNAVRSMGVQMVSVFQGREAYA
jgi:hypothetical protein